jgi:pseudouridine kinase
MAEVIAIGGANLDIKGRSKLPAVAHASNPGTVTVSPGGVARNIAENLARLAIDTALIAVVGEDASGRHLIDTTAAAGVDVSMIERVDMPTGTYLAILDEQGEMIVAVNDMRACERLSAERLERHAARLDAASFLIADCNLPTDSLHWLMGFAGKSGRRLLIDPVSVAKAERLVGSPRHGADTVITPNLQQAEAMTGEAEPAHALTALHRLGFANVVIHLGAGGALASDGSIVWTIAARHDGDVADVTGAGDAAVAGLVFGLVTGCSLAEAAELGQSAAALKLASSDSVSPHMSRARLLGVSSECGDPR